jgi:hypothetical protein
MTAPELFYTKIAKEREERKFYHGNTDGEINYQ